ncbi:YjgF-like protein, partial [Lindgomyces ingoldianus]
LNPDNVSAPMKPTYSHVCIAPLGPAKLVSIAGQIGMDGTGEVPSSFTEQVRVALENLKKCLASAGAMPKDIVKVTQFVVNLDATESTRGNLWLEFVGEHRPPSTLVGVAALASPELLYEVEATAVV